MRSRKSSLWQNPSGARKPDLQDALDNVSPKVRRAFEIAHQRLVELGIPHVLVGGVAVGAYGHHYATKDVDFLVGNEICDPSASKLVFVFAPGVPIRVGDVDIDYLDADVARKENPEMVPLLAELVEQARGTEQAVVAPVVAIVYMKLLANRPKDQTALIGLLNAGAVDVDEVFRLLQQHAPDKVVRFERLLARAAKQGA